MNKVQNDSANLRAEIAVCVAGASSLSTRVSADYLDAHSSHILTKEELAVCSNAGISAAEFLAAKPQATAENNGVGDRYDLTAAERAVCSATGISYEEFIAAKR